MFLRLRTSYSSGLDGILGSGCFAPLRRAHSHACSGRSQSSATVLRLKIKLFIIIFTGAARQKSECSEPHSRPSSRASGGHLAGVGLGATLSLRKQGCWPAAESHSSIADSAAGSSSATVEVAVGWSGFSSSVLDRSFVNLAVDSGFTEFGGGRLQTLIAFIPNHG